MALVAEVQRPKSPAARSRPAKRLLDASAAALGLALLAPIFVLIGVAIRLDSAGPVFFRQNRMGYAGRPFVILKFRSMVAMTETRGSTLTVAGDARVTRVGAFLRRAKLDELPQLVNVLMGQMSLVGPRPETLDLMGGYTPSERALLLSIPPGMTDYASLLLRDEGALLARVPDPERFYRERLMPLKHRLCADYIDQSGLWTDIRIILATILAFAFPPASRRLVDQATLRKIARLHGVMIDDVET